MRMSILALGAARARVYGDDGVERIGLTGEHGTGFERLIEGGQRLNVALDVGEDIFALSRQFEVGLDIAGATDQFFVVGDHLFQALLVPHQRFAGIGIVPEGRIGEFGFDCG
jgi:hypothetical protein